MFLGFLLKIYALFKGQKITRLVKIKGPAIVLSNHTSFPDFLYTTVAAYPKRVSYLAADKMFYDPVLGLFLRLARAIPKCLFQTDPVATLKAFRILKQNGIIGIFPEGQISPIGVTMDYNPSIIKLIQKAKVPVYMVKHRGAYLVNPPWTKKTFRGKIETTVDIVVTQEEVQSLSKHELHQRINDKLSFNTHEYNETRQMKTKLNDIYNLESVIYHCPNCGIDDLKSEKHQLVCTHCNSEFIYDEYGKLGGYRIDELYKIQESIIHQKFDKNPDFHMNADVKLECYRENRVVEVGQGTLRLDIHGYHFNGTVDGVLTRYDFDPLHIASLPSDLGINIQIYKDYMLYQFVFSDNRIPTQFVIAGEYIYKLANAHLGKI